MADSTTWTGDDDTEVTVRPGQMFKDGTIAVSVFDKLGTGATGYVTPDQAKEIGEELIALAGAGVEKVVLAACFPGCGWNGEVAVDADGKWTCPGCGKERQFKDHRGGFEQ